MRKTIAGIAGVCTFVLVLGFAALAAAQAPASASGKWQLSMEGPRGTFNRTLTLKQDDAGKLTGTIESNFGGQQRTQQVTGTVAGDKIEFTVTFTMRNGDTRSQKYTGTISADSMKGTVDFMGNPVDWTATRQK